MDLPPLHDAVLIRRYKRFLADVELADGCRVTAHCPNTGSMLSCWQPGAPVQLWYSDSPRRKLAWTLERIDMGGGWIGINTHRVNGVIAEAAAAGRLVGFEQLTEVGQELPLQSDDGERSRIDLLLSNQQDKVLVEVKNATYLEDAVVRFPDAVSVRAVKHLRLLQQQVAKGRRAAILFAVNRPEGEVFSPADAIYPAYGKALREAVERGVEACAVRIVHGRCSITTGARVPVLL